MHTRVAVLSLLLVAAAGALFWLRGQGETALTPSEAGADAHRGIEYGPHDRNRLDVYTPDAPGPHPTLIWFHQGGWTAGDKAASMPVWDWTDRGYAVVSVNYRYAIEPDTVAGSIADAIAAVQHVLDNHETWNLDEDRVGVYGFSAGGHLAAMVAHARLPVAAVAIAGAPTDFVPLLDPAVPFFDGNRGSAVVEAVQGLLGCEEQPASCREVATETSPARQPPGDVELLIVHGARDHIVDVDQAHRLDEHLRASGAEPTVVIIENGGHSPHVVEGGIDVFFDERLLS